MDSMTLGATPADEKCAQVGAPDYYETARLECQVYRRQLLRMYKAEHNPNGEDWGLPEHCTLRMSNNPHDAGTYHEVEVRYNDDFYGAVEAAFWFDANLPGHWDEEARAELAELIPNWKAA